MVNCNAPTHHIAFACSTDFFIYGCLRNCSRMESFNKTDIYGTDTSCVKRIVAAMIPQPLFDSFPTSLGTHILRKHS